MRHWREKDGRFYARVAVPKELIPFVGKSELIEPLGSDRRGAMRQHPAAVARLQAQIAKAGTEAVRQQGEHCVIRISPEAGSVKTGVYRDVPLHRQIIDLGFLDFVKSTKPGPLFHNAAKPEKYLGGARVTAGRLSEWMNRAGLVPYGVQPSHGWRHRFKTLGRELGLSDRIVAAVQGHAGRTAGDGYGDVSVMAMARVIGALPDYELGAELSATPYRSSTPRIQGKD